MQLFSISEIGILHKQILTIGGRPFSITVTRHFRPKSDHSNERIYCKPIDRETKNTIQGAVAGFLSSPIPEVWKILKNKFCCFLDKKKKKKKEKRIYKYILKNFSSYKEDSLSKAYQKNAALSAMVLKLR